MDNFDAVLDRNGLPQLLISLILGTPKLITALVTIVTDIQWVNETQNLFFPDRMANLKLIVV